MPDYLIRLDRRRGWLFLPHLPLSGYRFENQPAALFLILAK